MAQTSSSVADSVADLFTKRCEISHVEAIGPYRLIRLRSPSLREARWEPGDKIELFVASFTKRAYTPLSCEGDEIEIVAYVHGDAPGASWARQATAGQIVRAWGPSGSLKLGKLVRPAVFVGDETCVGLLQSLRSTRSGRNVVHAALEVTSRAATQPILDRLELEHVHLVERSDGDAHIRALEAWLDGLGTLESCVLSGKAQTIQALNRHVRARGLTSAQIATRAYWAPGKRGMD